MRTFYAENISQLSLDLLFDSVLIRENPGQRKPVFSIFYAVNA